MQRTQRTLFARWKTCSVIGRAASWLPWGKGGTLKRALEASESPRAAQRPKPEPLSLGD